MPNTPALVLTGATALHANDKVSKSNAAWRKIFCVRSALRSGLKVKTSWMRLPPFPAVARVLLSAHGSHGKSRFGTGPKRNYRPFISQQTALGAAKIALESSESPEQLRKRVTSPAAPRNRL